MELNKLILISEKGKECRDMIHILLSLGYPPESIIACVNAYCKTETVSDADLARIKGRIERMVKQYDKYDKVVRNGKETN